MLSSGRAISSVTRPPCPAAEPSGRSYMALTRCTSGSVSSGPTIPETKSAENSRRSASTKQTMSPPVTRSERHSTSPLPGTAGMRGRIVSRCTTRAPAAAATSAVRSLDPESTTTTSSTSGTRSTSSRRITATMSPTVASSSRAGSTTLTDCPVACLADRRCWSGRSAADQERASSQRSTSSSTSRGSFVIHLAVRTTISTVLAFGYSLEQRVGPPHAGVAARTSAEQLHTAHPEGQRDTAR
ncbi:cobalamin biosynthesis Mg chelatase CobN [Streptomyces sp. SAI-163]